MYSPGSKALRAALRKAKVAPKTSKKGKKGKKRAKKGKKAASKPRLPRFAYARVSDRLLPCAPTQDSVDTFGAPCKWVLVPKIKGTTAFARRNVAVPVTANVAQALDARYARDRYEMRMRGQKPPARPAVDVPKPAAAFAQWGPPAGYEAYRGEYVKALQQASRTPMKKRGGALQQAAMLLRSPPQQATLAAMASPAFQSASFFRSPPSPGVMRGGDFTRMLDQSMF